MSDLVKTLRKQSKEISSQGINGWGNTMNDAADEIERLNEALQGVIDWADFALSNPHEFDFDGVKNLDGPAFEKAREALFQETLAQPPKG